MTNLCDGGFFKITTEIKELVGVKRVENKNIVIYIKNKTYLNCRYLNYSQDNSGNDNALIVMITTVIKAKISLNSSILFDLCGNKIIKTRGIICYE